MQSKQSKWYAVYIKSRAEKKVALEMEAKGFNFYLPLIKKLKQWSDRRKWVEEPLFRSYIFVNIIDDDYYNVLNTNGVVRYVTFGGKAVPIPEAQIEAIRYFIEDKDPENIDESHWTEGKKVEVLAGSMAGLRGELVEVKGKSKVKIEIEAVNGTLLIEIPRNKLRFL